MCICVSALVSTAMTIISVKLVHYSNMCSTITDLVSLVQWLFRGFSFLLHWIKAKGTIWLYSWLLSCNMFYPFIFQQAFKTVLHKVCFNYQKNPYQDVLLILNKCSYCSVRFTCFSGSGSDGFFMGIKAIKFITSENSLRSTYSTSLKVSFLCWNNLKCMHIFWCSWLLSCDFLNPNTLLVSRDTEKVMQMFHSYAHYIWEATLKVVALTEIEVI